MLLVKLSNKGIVQQGHSITLCSEGLCVNPQCRNVKIGFRGEAGSVVAKLGD